MVPPPAATRGPDRRAAAAERADRADRNHGRPTLSFGDDGPTPYVDYAGIDALLGLQRPRSAEPAETAFIIATQVMELLFTLIRHEWEQARDALDADDVAGALAALRRGRGAQDVLVDSWELLATLKPTEFNRFRDGLGESSGFQSYTYRHLEFLLGNKSAAMVRPHRAMPDVRAGLERSLGEPSLYDAALRLLHRRGLPCPRSGPSGTGAAPTSRTPASSGPGPRSTPTTGPATSCWTSPRRCWTPPSTSPAGGSATSRRSSARWAPNRARADPAGWSG